MRVCVGRMLEVIFGAGSKLRDDDDDDDDDDVDDDDDRQLCVDEACPVVTSDGLLSPLPPPPLLPLIACHVPSRTLMLIRHLLGRIDMKTMAAGGAWRL